MKDQPIDETFLNEDIISKQNNDLWNILRKEAWEKRIPIHGHFEITPQCNLDCKMCYVHLTKNQMNSSSELSIEDWKRITDEAIENGMIFASISGGECLTSPYFDDLYLYLKSKGIIIFVLTNGVLLSSKIGLFADYPPALIQVSMYGYDEDSYEKVTGHRKYDVVDRSILTAKECGINISIAVTASKYLPSVYAIVKKYYELGIGATVNSWLIPPYSSTGRLLDDFCLSPEEQVSISKEILLASNQGNPIPYIGILPDPNTNSEKIHKGLLCAAGRSDFSINWKGEMSLCVSMNDVTGKPLKDGFKKAWNDTVSVADNYLMPAECFECDYINVCNRCPAYHRVYGNEGHCNPNICEESILMVKQGIKSIKL